MLTAKIDFANLAFHLSAIVFSLNTVFTEAVQTRAVELLYGQSRRFSGDIFILRSRADDPCSAANFVNCMKRIAVNTNKNATTSKGGRA